MITLITNKGQKIYAQYERVKKIKAMLSKDGIIVLNKYKSTEEELNDLLFRFTKEVKEKFII